MPTKTKAQAVNELKTEILLMKRDQVRVEQVLTKLDTTIDSISGLTHEMSTMIRLHEERIATQIQQDHELSLLIEQRRTETEKGFKELEAKIEKQFTTFKDESVTQFKEFKKEFMQELSAQKKKLHGFDIFKAGIMAVAGILTFVAGAAASGYLEAFFVKLIIHN